MSVLTVVRLACNGRDCTRVFVPDEPLTSTRVVRRLADAADWLTNFRSRGLDYCPVCADSSVLGDTRLARGICGACATEQVVTLRAVIKQHRVRVNGTVKVCPGGGLAPQRLVRNASQRITVAAAGHGRAWQGLI